MILSSQEIRRNGSWIIDPFVERTVFKGMSYGLSHAGYDVRIAEEVNLSRGEFALASTVERFAMPTNLIAMVHDKSTWARRGLSLFNTVIEPGWHGFLTLELVCHAPFLSIASGSPIAQIVFMRMTEPTDRPYAGKYQNQSSGPQPARMEMWKD